MSKKRRSRNPCEFRSPRQRRAFYATKGFKRPPRKK